jgi:hypothetical protein
LFSHLGLGLPNGFFPSGFPAKIFVSISHLPHAHTPPISFGPNCTVT